MVHLYLLYLKKSLPFVVPFHLNFILTLMLLLENCPQTLGKYKLLTTYVKNCVQPGYNYFEEKFSNNLIEPLTAFQYACYFDPVKIAELKPSAADLDNLRAFPFFKLG